MAAQHWQVICPRRRETLGNWGKLGECLFDGSPESLVIHLAVPVLSPGIGTSTYERDSVKQTLEEHSSPKRWRNDSESLPVSTQSSCGPLLNLPLELLDHIFQVSDIETVLHLGLTCREFCSIARRHIKAYTASCFGRWAGEKIICVGSYIRRADYPPDLLSESDRKELEEGSERAAPFRNWKWPNNDLYRFAISRCENVSKDNILPIESLMRPVRRLMSSSEEMAKLSRLQKKFINQDVLHRQITEFYPEDRPWVLRNLTTLEYVRAEAVAIEPRHIHGPQIRRLGFGEVILSRICWSSADSVSMQSRNNNIHRGVWAGHRFDITTLERHEKTMLRGAEWRDVSDEVAQEIAEIWKSEFGSNWRIGI